MLRTIGRWIIDAYRYVEFETYRFRGIYQTFDQAKAASPIKNIGFNYEQLARKYRADLKLCLNSSDYPVLFHLSRINRGNCTILDFGGNVGIHFLRYRRYLNLDNVTWIVCDMSEITKVGQELCASVPNIEFINELTELKVSQVDVLLAVDSLHYIECPKDLLSALGERRFRPRHILFDQMPLHDVCRFVTLQNGGGTYYPMHVFNRREFIAGIENADFRLIDTWSDSHYSCVIPFHPNKSVRAYSGLYFVDSRRLS
jgi:putative methyltransferase (TIGR04325 family)